MAEIITMFTAKSREALTKFQAVYFAKRFEMWSDLRGFCIKSQREYFEGRGAQISHLKIIGARRVT